MYVSYAYAAYVPNQSKSYICRYYQYIYIYIVYIYIYTYNHKDIRLYTKSVKPMRHQVTGHSPARLRGSGPHPWPDVRLGGDSPLDGLISPQLVMAGYGWL